MCMHGGPRGFTAIVQPSHVIVNLMLRTFPLSLYCCFLGALYMQLSIYTTIMQANTQDWVTCREEYREQSSHTF